MAAGRAALGAMPVRHGRPIRWGDRGESPSVVHQRNPRAVACTARYGLPIVTQHIAVPWPLAMMRDGDAQPARSNMRYAFHTRSVLRQFLAMVRQTAQTYRVDHA
ncbi:MAG: hypothetical protein ABSC95_02755 [Acetobacteraceae bacterium]|jgi:hypothetical protein